MNKIYINTDPVIKKVLTELLANTHIEITDEINSDLIISDKETDNNKTVLILGKDIELPLKLDNLLNTIKYNAKSQPLIHNDIELHVNTMELKHNGKSHSLTEKELDIFVALIKNKKLSNNELLKIVWGYADNVNSNTVATHISRIRKKISEDIIKTDNDNNYII
ncbi:MAG: winged helix-turn-helix domain-containing protein [Alphaproteobacteria bacterium]